MIDANYIDSNFAFINCSFAEFILFFDKMHIVKVNRVNWANNQCNCSFFLKNYCCYHVMAVAQNEKSLEIPIQHKNVAIKHKIKKGRKSKAKSALQKNLD